VHSERFFQELVIRRRSERPTGGILKLLAVILLLLGLLGLLACSEDDQSARNSQSDSTAASQQESVSSSSSLVPQTDRSAGEAPSSSASVAGLVGGEEPLAGVNTLPAVKAGVPAKFGSGVSAVVNDYRAVNVQARAPGESSGPAIAVTLEVSNESGANVDLSQLSVTASDSQGLPALPIESEQAAAFEGALEPGSSRIGVYVFRLNEERSPSLLLNVQAGFSRNALQFELK
jgi:cytoskeletal protein RodZ